MLAQRLEGRETALFILLCAIPSLGLAVLLTPIGIGNLIPKVAQIPLWIFVYIFEYEGGGRWFGKKPMSVRFTGSLPASLLTLVYSLLERIRECQRPSLDLFTEWMTYSERAVVRLRETQQKLLELDVDGLAARLSPIIAELLDEREVLLSAQSRETSWSDILRRHPRDIDVRARHLYRWAERAEDCIRPVEAFIEAYGTGPPAMPQAPFYVESGEEVVRFWEESTKFKLASRNWRIAVKRLHRRLPRAPKRFRWLPRHHHV
jgi:hypothetical protein